MSGCPRVVEDQEYVEGLQLVRAAPLALVGLLSRQALMRWRERMIVGGKNAKIALGLLLTLLGLLIVSGLDKRLESFLVENSPQWLTDLTTWF
jgi:hypothetical protein